MAANTESWVSPSDSASQSAPVSLRGASSMLVPEVARKTGHEHVTKDDDAAQMEELVPSRSKEALIDAPGASKRQEGL